MRIPDPHERHVDILPCSCEWSGGSWAYCALHRDMTEDQRVISYTLMEVEAHRESPPHA